MCKEQAGKSGREAQNAASVFQPTGVFKPQLSPDRIREGIKWVGGCRTVGHVSLPYIGPTLRRAETGRGTGSVSRMQKALDVRDSPVGDLEKGCQSPRRFCETVAF